MDRTYGSVLALVVMALVWSSAATSPPASVTKPIPYASARQVARETDFLQHHFLSTPCFTRLHEAGVSSRPLPRPEEAYVVAFPRNPLADDAFSYQLHVTKELRIGYLVRSGGMAGVHETLGPVKMSECLRDTFYS